MQRIALSIYFVLVGSNIQFPASLRHVHLSGWWNNVSTLPGGDYKV